MRDRNTGWAYAPAASLQEDEATALVGEMAEALDSQGYELAEEIDIDQFVEEVASIIEIDEEMDETARSILRRGLEMLRNRLQPQAESIECGPALMLNEETGRFEMGEQFADLMADVVKLVEEQGYSIGAGMDIGSFLEQLDRLLASDANLSEDARHFLKVATEAIKKAAFPHLS